MFANEVQEKFGAYDYGHAVNDLLVVKQHSSVEEYPKAFEAAQFQVFMNNSSFDDTFFASHYVNGLREDIRGVVQGQVLDILTKASYLARNQQRVLEYYKPKQYKTSSVFKPTYNPPKQDVATTSSRCGRRDN